MDKVRQNNIEEIVSEAGKADENNKVTPLFDESQEGLSRPESSESLDNLLWFDAQVLASSSSPGIADNSNVIEFAERSENQQSDSSLVATDEYKTTNKLVRVIEEGHELSTPDLSKSGVEQQDKHLNVSLVSAQDERISQLESELSDLKKKHEVQSEAYKALEVASYKLKRTRVVSLGVAVLALILSFWLGNINLAYQNEPEEQQKVVMDVDDQIDALVIEADKQKINELQIKVKALEPETRSPVKKLILPEDDISDIRPTADIVKEREDVEVPSKGWVVNLNSYQQRSETDKKMKELQKKGIPTEMIVVNVKGVQWFRIRGDGFETKAGAESYAAKIHKILNDNHTWVSKI